MAKKFYAIRAGVAPCIVQSWDECQKLISGVSGAEFRGFNNRDEAEAYLRGEELGTAGPKLVRIDRPEQEGVLNIYTDGSYKNGYVSVGTYIESANRAWSHYGVVMAPEYSSLNNIAGELLAVLVAVQMAHELGSSFVNIFYDYEGVAAWYDGSWKARGELQMLYANLLRQFRLQYGMDYKFIHVKGHSGVRGNSMADSMAKRAYNLMHYIDKDKILRGTLKAADVPLYTIS